MAITNLTNTTWYIPSGWSATSGFGIFNIGFKMYPDGVMSSYRGSSQICLGYGAWNGDDFPKTSNSISFWETDEFTSNHGDPYFITNSSSFVLEITGGADVTNTSLIAWLLTHGIQLKVTDLTNTSWIIPAGWEAEAGYGQFDVEFDGKETFISSGTVSDIYSGVLNIGYSFTSFDGDTFGQYATQDYIYFGGLNYNNNYYDFLFHFIGGTDTTNPKLIAWLSKYGELQGGEAEHTLTYDLTQLDLSDAAVSITVVAKAPSYRNSLPSNAVRYKKTFGFHIDDESYRAERNMLWSDWVANTTFNTAGFYIENMRVYIQEGDYTFAIEDVFSFQRIVADTWYELVYAS